jgi:hypothetical protein
MILAYWFAGNGVEKEKLGENRERYKNSRGIPIDAKLFLDHSQTVQKTT